MSQERYYTETVLLLPSCPFVPAEVIYCHNGLPSHINQLHKRSASTLFTQRECVICRETTRMKRRLIAHRGDMTSYPENSLLAIQAAVNLGFTYIEIDIQLSKDAVPIVIHDDNLQRTVGINKNIRDLTANEINTYIVNHPNQQNDDLALFQVPTLQAVIEKLNNYPEIILFVEIKRQSIEYFGLSETVDAVLIELKQANFEVVIISFVADVVSHIQLQGIYSVGWVVTEFDQVHQQQAQLMKPDYLFCNVCKINDPSNLWQGSWQWALYDLRDPTYTSELLTQGVSLIETGDIVRLSRAKEFC